MTIIPRATIGPYVDSSDKALRDKDGNITRKGGALKRWKQNICASAKVAMWEHDLSIIEDAPVTLIATFILERPKSVKREHPHKGLDLSKLLRAIEDALEGVAYANDAQICGEMIRKRYAVADEAPGVQVSWQEVT
jgi:crossover junction endodeoxyribonuclease RusA